MIIPEAYSADEAGASDAEGELPSLDPSLSTLLSSFADSPAVESVFSASSAADFSCVSAAGAAASVASLFSGCWAQAIAPPAISSKAAIVTIVFFIAFKIKRFLFTSSVRICLANRSDKMEFKRRAIRIKMSATVDRHGVPFLARPVKRRPKKPITAVSAEKALSILVPFRHQEP